MFDFFIGTIVTKKPAEVVLEVGNIGYRFSISLTTFASLSEAGERFKILSYFHVREDHQQLFGFSSEEERELFRLLISVSGIGPKVALTVLSGMGSEKLRQTIVREDLGSLTQIPGVGKKTAERLVLELREKISKLKVEDKGTISLSQTIVNEILEDSTAALVALGYKRPDSQKAVEKVLRQKPEAKVADVIREALNHIR